MAAPACDASHDERVFYALWNPTVHRRCFFMQRMALRELLLHCACRTSGIGILPVDVLLVVFRRVWVVYV